MKKRLTGLLLSLLIILSMGMTAMAATVTVTDDKGLLTNHTFAAYQVLSGTQDAQGNFGNADWGNGINKDAFLAELQKLNGFQNCDTGLEFVELIKDEEYDSELLNKIAQIAYNNKNVENKHALTTGNNELPTGYYLIVDETESVGDDGVYNAALLQVTDTINIAAKTDKPFVEKKVKENVKAVTDDKNNEYGDQYNDVADYNIGDAVPFAFYSYAPDMSRFETYKYVFHDVMSAGLTFDEKSVKVSVNGKEVDSSAYSVVSTGLTDGCTFEVVIPNLKDIATQGQLIRVDFNATLNTSAEIGLPGNPNKVKLEYSNNPNVQGDENTSKTEWDEVIVFTYELDVTKVSNDSTPVELKDAEFKLKNATGKWVKVDGDGKVTGWVDLEADASVLKSNANGFFKVIGLDDGTYYLKETKAPAGYNILTEEIKLVITATTNNGHSWTDGVPANALTALTLKVDDGNAIDGVLADGSVATNIVNNKGAILPGTGGMGTTIFYVAGGIIVLAAAVLLLKRRRA